MFKEVLHIVPQMSSGDLNKMEQNLGQRFTRIAKKFGKGLTTALAISGGAGIALALVDKLLNPLKEVSDAIEKTLHLGDQLSDSAAQFNTSAGELSKLQSFGRAKGLGPEEVNLLVSKFQNKVAEASADTNLDTSVRNFVGQKNSAQGFLTYLEGIQKLRQKDPQAAIRAENEVFGARSSAKVGSFLEADFGKLSKDLSGVSAAKINKVAKKLGGLNDLTNTNAAVREQGDFVAKGDILNTGLVNSLSSHEQAKLNSENAKIAQAEKLAKAQEGADAIINLIEAKGLPLVGDLVTGITQATEYLKRIAGSPLMRRFGLGGGEKKGK